MNNSTKNNMLEVRGLSKEYDTFKLNKISFDVQTGYIMGFIGPNGTGKTTTIKEILNIIKRSSGSVKIMGREMDISDNMQLGVVMDTPMYVEEWTLRDVENAISPFYKTWDKAKFKGYLNRFGLDPGKKVQELSRGMKVKLQIAAALSHDARLLILDEPTSGLDPVARDEICDLLQEFVSDEGRSVLFSTHITTDLDKIADHITFILDGRIVFTGEKDILMEKYTRITGGPGALSPEQKNLVIGYREYENGFEGMLETGNLGGLPKSVITEDITLDEIIIFMSKGA